MRVLVVGAGGVGSAIAAIAARSASLEHIVVADVEPARAKRAAAMARSERIEPAHVDAADQRAVVELAAACRADVIVNACDPRLNPPIFDAAFEVGCHYLDMAMNMSTPHPTDPYREVGTMLGDAQLAVADEWVERGLLALVGMGVEPGFSDVAARYASDHLFTTIDEIGVRDGSDLVVDGFAFAPTFSIWTTIEECLNPPLVYEHDRGWFTTAPFSEPETVPLPRRHRRPALRERRARGGRADAPVARRRPGDVQVRPRRRVPRRPHHVAQARPRQHPTRRRARRDGGATRPRRRRAAQPGAARRSRMRGRTCAGTLVTGTGVDGRPRSTYLYQVVDNEWTMREFGHQAVVWQTAVHPVVALELLADGEWKGVGVLGPEALPPDPFLDRLGDHGAPWAIEERAPSAG